MSAGIFVPRIVIVVVVLSVGLGAEVVANHSAQKAEYRLRRYPSLAPKVERDKGASDDQQRERSLHDAPIYLHG
jgi:nucleoside recognition membrane protein YjiH